MAPMITCMACGETRPHLAKQMCARCYRRNVTRAEYPDPGFLLGEAPGKHSRDLARTQKRQRKALSSILSGVDDLVELLEPEESQTIREIIAKYWDQLRPTPRQTLTIEPENQTEEFSEPERMKANPETLNTEQAKGAEQHMLNTEQENHPEQFSEPEQDENKPEQRTAPQRKGKPKASKRKTSKKAA